MFRYYAIATAIVVVAGALLFAHRLVTHEFTVHSNVAVPPKAAAPEGVGTHGASTFDADAPWALAALPECATQIASTEGPAEKVPAPARALRIPPGTVLQAGPCRIVVEPDDFWVERRTDRLRAPPHAALYREPDGTVVSSYERGSRREVRRYTLVR